jgi:DNA-binding transcriptional MerR regulator
MSDPAQRPAAFLTIGALAQELGLPQHTLRYWETRFSQLRPLTRAGNRRYYRPEDADIARTIDRLLNKEGYTFKGVQQILADGGKSSEPVTQVATAPVAVAQSAPSPILPALKAIRDRLAKALTDDAALA